MVYRAALLVLVASLAGQNGVAFAPLGRVFRSPTSALWETQEKIDVSVPYDAAARLAYDEWRVQFDKGAFDQKRYEAFKANYEAIAVANVSAKKAARESGGEPKLLSLNQYGDFTAAEYEAAQTSGKSPPSTTGDILGKAVEAAESQSAASTALGDAAAALAEEEEKLAKELGYDSVEELEVAMDTMEGIAEDGGALADGLAREARVRSAYLDWCKEYGKEPDESRFPTFSSNFLGMEEYANETGKEMTLNQYADCTEEEYLVATAEEAVAQAEAAIAEVEGETIQEEVKSEDKLDAEAKARQEAEEKAKKEAVAKKKVEVEAKAKKEAEARAKLPMDELRKEIEKERADRQNAQARAIAEAAAEAEAAAIAAAKAAAEQEVAYNAQRRAIDEKAAEILRQQAREFEEKQKQIRAATLAAKKAKDAAYARSAAANARQAKKGAAPKVGLLDLGSMFKPAPAPKKAAPWFDLSSMLPKPAAKEAEPRFDLGSLLSKPAGKKDAPSFDLGSLLPKPAAKKAVVKTPAPSPKPANQVNILDPVTEAFASIFGSPKTAPARKPAPKPVPKPAPAPVAKKEPFSFFGGAKPTTAPKVAQPKTSSEGRPTLSLFGGSTPTPARAPRPVAAPAAAPKPATKPFSFFGGPTPKPAPAQAPAPPPAPTTAFSFFGGAKPVASTIGTKTVPPAKKPKPSAARATLAIPKNEKSNNFGFAFGGTKKVPAAKTDDVPVLSEWTQNSDGSLTGRISNSKNFRNGTKITTSPVRRGAKGGQVVKTSSGSEYRLK